MSDATARLNKALEGRYRIDRELGEGGMATVYLAEDLKHERKVALKVLKPELGAVVGAERFLAEIKTTANLQHPHILPLHDSGEAHGLLFYVMPYVEGESLRERLDREKQLPIDEAVRIATDVAEALDYAHRQGVIHRDMKPANVLLQDGKPMIADFGIALAVTAGGGRRLTQTGLGLGTPHYMSPEQATGDQNVGPSTDTFALGCVLYEMLVGEPPFTGSTPQAVLGKVINGSVEPVTAHRSTVPPNVDAVVSKALERVPADRFTTAQAFAAALSDGRFRHGAPLPEQRPDATSTRWRLIAAGLAGTTALFAAGSMWSLMRADRSSTPIARFDVTPPERARIVRDYTGVAVALSPDGERFVYVRDGVQPLHVRDMQRLEPTPIPGTAGVEGPDNPVFSPDGTSVAYWDGGGLKAASLLGGGSREVVPGGTLGSRYLDWGPDGLIYYVSNADDGRGLYRVSPDMGDPELIAVPPDADTRVVLPDALPGGRGTLITLRREAPEDATVGVIAGANGEVRELFPGLSARHASSGHVVYATADGTLMAAAFDVDRLEAGPPVALGPRVAVRMPGLGAQFALSETGSLIYRTGEGDLVEAVWVDRNGRATAIDPAWAFAFDTDYSSVALSPEDDLLAVSLRGGDPPGFDVWIKELDDGPLSRTTFLPGNERRPSWSPDGEELIFIDGGDVRRSRADGTGDVTTLVDIDRNIAEALMSPDGSWLVYRAGSTTSSSNPDVFATRVGADGTTRELLTGDHVEWTVSVSPDGRWLAYTSDESGRLEVYVRPFPTVDSGKWQVSTAGGWAPVWSRNGRELFYIGGVEESDAEMVAVQVPEGDSFASVNQQVLFPASEFLVPQRGYDVTADGGRFVMFRPLPAGDRLVLVQNFFGELDRLVPN